MVLDYVKRKMFLGLQWEISRKLLEVGGLNWEGVSSLEHRFRSQTHSVITGSHSHHQQCGGLSQESGRIPACSTDSPQLPSTLCLLGSIVYQSVSPWNNTLGFLWVSHSHSAQRCCPKDLNSEPLINSFPASRPWWAQTLPFPFIAAGWVTSYKFPF